MIHRARKPPTVKRTIGGFLFPLVGGDAHIAPSICIQKNRFLLPVKILKKRVDKLRLHLYNNACPLYGEVDMAA